MTNKTLTISIASYNVEKYLDKTLSSLIDESTLDDLEVLIINDESKDSTPQIAEKYCSKYPHAFKLINKKNGGWGSTVNKSIELATAKYFKILDGDDWFDTKNLKEYIAFLKKCDTDIVLTDYTTVCMGKENKIVFKYNKNEVLPITSLDFLGMHSLTVRTELLKSNGIRLLEHCFYTDLEFDVRCYNVANTFVYLPINIYMYRLGDTGQSVSLPSLINHRHEHESVVKEIVAVYKSNKTKFTPHLDSFFLYLVDYQLMIYAVNKVSKESILDFKNFYRYLKKDYPESLKHIEKKYVLMYHFSWFIFRPFNRILRKKKNVE